MFLVAYPRETQEMVLDAHNRAFAFFGGVPERMVYDNPKTIVQTVLVGKAREFHPRFLMLANHYLFEPVACTPASGWGEAGFRKACFALPQPARCANRAVGRGAKGKWRTRWAMSGNGVSPPGRPLLTWLPSMSGWRPGAGSWPSGPTRWRRNAASPRCLRRNSLDYGSSPRSLMATSSSLAGCLPPAWWPMTETVTASRLNLRGSGCHYGPGLTGSAWWRMGGPWRNMPAVSVGSGCCLILGTTCRSWRRSREPCAMEHPSSTGHYPLPLPQ